MWIISSVAVLRFAPFLICFTYFPLMQSMHCSISENSNGGRISFLTRLSILPLEIWPKKQCHNFDESWVLFLFFCSLSERKHAYSLCTLKCTFHMKIINKAHCGVMQHPHDHYYTIWHTCHVQNNSVLFCHQLLKQLGSIYLWRTSELVLYLFKELISMHTLQLSRQ